MRHRLALLSALLLGAPPVASGGTEVVRLGVSATVVRTVRVSVAEGTAGTASLSVRTVGGTAWAATALSLSKSTGADPVPGVRITPYEADPSYLVVTVLADAPAAAGGEASARR
ncbi:MAG TPA: hypothetical protein VFK90_00660 [Anaeromyxobacter sp.]|nr:hypothetical protein [Anaeromyxobacter sp.]